MKKINKVCNVTLLMSYALKTGLTIKTSIVGSMDKPVFGFQTFKNVNFQKNIDLNNLDKMTQRKMPIYLQMKSCLKNASNFKCCYRHT